MNKKYTCIIPSRFESSRFPGKPLAFICGKEMLSWVYEHACRASMVEDVIIAVYDDTLLDFCNEKGYKVYKVDERVRNGSEAVADCARRLDLEYVFEMQGDQPLVTPEIIDDFLIKASAIVGSDPQVDVVHPFTKATKEHIESPDVLKVVKTKNDRLIFQSRHPLMTGYRTLGLYLWKKTSLVSFLDAPVSDIEKAEDSHPIRLYIEDMFVQGVPLESDYWVEVDRPHQIGEVESLMKRGGII